MRLKCKEKLYIVIESYCFGFAFANIDSELPLHRAVYEGNLPRMRKILVEQPEFEMNEIDLYGNTALMLA